MFDQDHFANSCLEMDIVKNTPQKFELALVSVCEKAEFALKDLS